MFKGGSEVDQALQALADRLRFAEAPRTILLVGGGAALSLLGFIRRATRDVDVIAVGTETGNGLTFGSAAPLPNYLSDAIQRTAEDLTLPADWMNSGPTALVDFGLPEGFLSRCVRRDYGNLLTIFFLGRKDLICLKAYAATDHGGGRHLSDLVALEPTKEELEIAGRWAMSQDPSAEFKWSLSRLLTEIGHGDVADKL